jgi:hypothetical protein
VRRQPLDACQLTKNTLARSFDVHSGFHRPALDLPASAEVRRRIINEFPAGSSTTAIRQIPMSSVAPRRHPGEASAQIARPQVSDVPLRVRRFTRRLRDDFLRRQRASV